MRNPLRLGGAEGMALNQNWDVGDFETWIDRAYVYRAYGVEFLRADIEDVLRPGWWSGGSLLGKPIAVRFVKPLFTQSNKTASVRDTAGLRRLGLWRLAECAGIPAPGYVGTSTGFKEHQEHFAPSQRL